MREIWKDIKGYEGLYQISNFGNVKSLKRQTKRKSFKRKYGNVEKELNDSKFFVCEKELYRSKRSGYYNVNLYKNNIRKNYQVHRLVAIHFIDNPLNKEIVNHLDGNRLNNKYFNLEWVTIKENNQHAFDTGLINSRMKKIICKTNGNVYRSINRASEILNISTACIRNVLNGKQSSTKGMEFEYYEKET